MVGDTALIVPPRRDSNTGMDANTRLPTPVLVKMLHSFRDQPHLYDVSESQDEDGNTHLKVVPKNLLPDSVHTVVDLKSRMGRTQSIEMWMRDTRAGDLPESLMRADFVEWQAPHAPRSPRQAALMAQLSSSAQVANASGDQPADAWSLTGLRAQLQQIEQQPAMSAVSAIPAGSERICFKHTLKESQLAEIEALPGGLMNRNAVFQYQDGIERQLTGLVNADLLSSEDADQFLMQYGFDDFFPMNMLATSNVAYMRLEMMTACLITSIQEECEQRRLLSPQDKQFFMEMLDRNLGHLKEKCEELERNGWNDAMIDYELQPFNFTAAQFKSIFLQDQEHALRNRDTLRKHIDWLLERREALRGIGLNEQEISAGLGWLAHRESISECLSREDGYSLVEAEMQARDEHLRGKYAR